MKYDKSIIYGTELVYKNKPLYYAKREFDEDGQCSHLCYSFEDGWPFPKYHSLNRSDFRVRRTEKEKFDLDKIEEALF
jgi:hypothetical protein